MYLISLEIHSNNIIMKVILRIGTLLLAMFFLVACQPEEDQSIEDHEDITTVGMLQHIVYFYLNEDVTDEEKTDFEEGLKRLLSIDEVYFYQVGIPGKTADRDVTDHTFGYSISSWFQTMDDYEVYAEHPVHLEFIDDYSHLWADVIVYDSEIVAEKE